MTYSISQAADLSGLSVYTLRYYEKEGLLPFVERLKSGKRAFKDHDLEMLSIINCLKSTGMQIKEIRTYIDWYQEGDATLEKRLKLFQDQKKAVEAQMEQLKGHLKKIDQKIKYYEYACEKGSAKVCEGVIGCEA